MSEVVIAASSVAHLAFHAKTRKIEYKILYYESVLLLAAGLSSMVAVVTIQGSLFDTNGIFYNIFGQSLSSSWFPIEPIDLIFMGLGLGGATILLDFVTRFYSWDRKGLLAVLPWIFVGQYRFLHEFVWVFSLWVIVDAHAGNSFSDSNKGPILPLPPAFLTHCYAILFVLFTALAFVVLLEEGKKKVDLTA